MNLTSQIKQSGFSVREFEGFDVSDAIRFKGPESLGELRELQQKENFDYFKKQLELEHETKKFHSSRHILCSKPEYIMESMEKKDTKAELGDESFDFHLDPNRIRTDAEIQLFADVFSISFDEARQILKKAGGKCQS